MICIQLLVIEAALRGVPFGSPITQVSPGISNLQRARKASIGAGRCPCLQLVAYVSNEELDTPVTLYPTVSSSL